MAHTDNTSTRLALGQRIADERYYCDLSQRALAQKSGVSRSEIQAIEAGKVNVSFDVLCRLADALENNVFMLLLGIS